MRRACLSGLLIAASALPAVAETPLERALEVPKEGPLYTFDVKIKDNTLDIDAKVDPSKPEGDRLSLVSPDASTFDDAQAKRFADLKQHTKGDVWCSSFAENIPDDAALLSESQEEAVYGFTPVPGEDDGDMAKVKSLQNSGQAYLTGFDFHAKARLADHVTATTSLSYGAGRDTDGDLPMRPVPPLYGRTSVIYETQKWTGELFARYNTWKEVQDIPLSGGEVSIYTPDGVPSWWTLNLRSNVQVVEHLEVVASLENIFDLHYRPYASGVSAPGRNLIVSLRAAL